MITTTAQETLSPIDRFEFDVAKRYSKAAFQLNGSFLAKDGGATGDESPNKALYGFIQVGSKYWATRVRVTQCEFAKIVGGLSAPARGEKTMASV